MMILVYNIDPKGMKVAICNIYIIFDTCRCIVLVSRKLKSINDMLKSQGNYCFTKKCGSLEGDQS